MNKRFKIGDTIHHIESNKPTQSEVKAILIIEGDIEVGYRKYKTEPNEQKTVYLVGYSTHVESKDAFGTIEELKHSLFPENIEKAVKK